MKNNLVINWHLLEPCQLKCKYCYAEWNKSNFPLIFKNQEKSKQLINEISNLAKNSSLRLSFAGGEPLLDSKISQKIKWAEEKLLKVSIITNGDFLSKRLNETDLLRLFMLGISIDSFDVSKNIEIGRATASNRVPDYDEIITYLLKARKVNPNLKIKINTVVNLFNWEDNMVEEMEKIKPDKWKIFRVLPATDRGIKQAITNVQFETFKSKHQHLPYAQFENNNDMFHSYLMLDPYGRFFYNLEKGKYGYSEPILEIGIEQALRQIKFNKEKFVKRYKGEVE